MKHSKFSTSLLMGASALTLVSGQSWSNVDKVVTKTRYHTVYKNCACGATGVYDPSTWDPVWSSTASSTWDPVWTSTASTTWDPVWTSSTTSVSSTWDPVWTSTTSSSSWSKSSTSTDDATLTSTTTTTTESTTTTTTQSTTTTTESTTTTTETTTTTTTTPTTTTTTTKSPSTTTTTTKPPSTTTTTTKPPSTTTTTTTKPPSTTPATTTTTVTTTTSAAPIVTDEAYIDTVLRHHNVHRANHSANALFWSPSLADTARTIAATCSYGHDTTTNGGGYGQNIGAGYPSTNMAAFITGGLYNSEVNSYTYYGGEPDTNTVDQWGHFSQIVWKSTTAVGCYTQDCSATGLKNTGAGVPPFFTVCNYSPAGNVIGAFSANVVRPLGFASIDATYECGSPSNCVGPTT